MSQMSMGVLIASLIMTLSEQKEPTPSGTLYAVLMGRVSLDSFQQVLYILEKMKMIKVNSHLVTWVEPAAGTKEAKMVADIRQVYAEAKAEAAAT